MQHASARDETGHGVISIRNDGQKIVRTNYWETDYAKKGIVYFSVNAGALRMLLPDRSDADLLKAVTQAKYVILSRDMRGQSYEVLLEDESSSPYAIQSPIGAWDRLLPTTEDGREGIPFLVYTKGSLLLTLTAKFRVVPHLPCGKRWNQDEVTRRSSKTNSLIDSTLGPMNDAEKVYHTTLPSELQRWYCYPRDGGHCILCILKTHFHPEQADWDEKDWPVPVPVRTVLRGYSIRDGFVIVDVPYDSFLGVRPPEEDREW